MDKELRELEELLVAGHAAHQKLLQLLQRKRQAMSRADAGQITDCCRLENQKIQEISALEKRRLELVGEMTLQINPEATGPLKLIDLAQQFPEPTRGRLLVLRQQLREQMQAVQTESGVVRRASESMLRHMQGLVQTIGSAVTNLGLYAPDGGRPRQALAVSTFNTTA